MKYAWKPDVPDYRDRLYKAPVVTLPKSVSRIGLGNPIEDQGNLGSCTGNSSTSALEIVLGKTCPQLSRLMAYYNARVIDKTVGSDDGAYIRSVIKGLVQNSVSTEALWPYVPSKFKVRPYSDALADALKRWNQTKQTLEYVRLSTLKDVKTALATRNPVVFGFMVPESFENLPKSALLRLPSKGEESLGGHAVMACGYSDTATDPYIWVRNSWGPDWGLQGYFKMTQDWFTDSRRLVDDMWVIRKV